MKKRSVLVSSLVFVSTLLVPTLLVPTLLFAQEQLADPVVVTGTDPSGTCSDVQTCVNTLMGLINNIVPILIGITLILFIYGVYKYFFAGGDEKELGKSKSYMLYGIVSLAIIIGVWSLVGIVAKAFFPGRVSVPQFQFQTN